MIVTKTLAQGEEAVGDGLTNVSTRVREGLLRRARIACAIQRGLTLQQLFDQGLELRLAQIEAPKSEE